MIRIDPAHPAFEQLPRDQQALIYYRDIGWTIDAIADEFDVTRRTVRIWLDSDVRAMYRASADRAKGRPAPPPTKPRKYDEVFALYEAGKTPMEICAAVKLPRASVYRVLRERYGSLRDRSRA